LALQYLSQTKQDFLKHNNQIEMLGPIPALMERKAGKFRAQLLLQAKHRQVLHQCLKQLTCQLREDKNMRKVRWFLDVDPQEVI
jgi:primosomal protein N' (replication factor Y) (superfamily II helicase)